MKIYRTAAAIAMVAGALWASAPAQAQTVSSKTVTLSGMVSGAPESVSLSGKATIVSRVVTSERNTAQAPSVTLDIDLSGISGVGQSTKTKYVTAAKEIALRTLTATDIVEITFPFYPSGTNGVGTARTGVARFSLGFDVNKLVLSSASGTLAGP